MSMPSPRFAFISFISFIGTALLLGACGASRTHTEDEKLYSDARAPGLVPPADSDENNILTQMDKLKIGQSVTLGGRTVSVASEYQAASGRQCRVIDIAIDPGQATRRLVCRIDDAWSYAPEVFPAPSSLLTR